MNKDDFIESRKRRDIERSAALRVYIIWAWIEKQELKALKEGVFFNRDSLKCFYPLFRDLQYRTLEGECPWCQAFSLCVTMETGHRERNDYCQMKCGGCPLNLIGQCCDGPEDVLWRKWRFGEGAGNNHAICAGEIAALAWRVYKGLGG